MGARGSCRCLLGCRTPLNPKCWSRVLLLRDNSEEGNVFPKFVEPLEKEVTSCCVIDLQPRFQDLEPAVPEPNAGFLSAALPEMCAVRAPAATCGVDGSIALLVNRNFLPALLSSELSAACSASAPDSSTEVFLSLGTQGAPLTPCSDAPVPVLHPSPYPSSPSLPLLARVEIILIFTTARLYLLSWIKISSKAMNESPKCSGNPH